MLRSRTISWILGGFALGLAFVLGFRYFASPVRFIPEGRLWVFVSPGCPFSVDIYRQIRDSELRAIVAVPADDDPSMFPRSLEMCDTTLVQIEWEERWPSRFLPRHIACRWLIEDASAIHSKHAVHWPAWYDGARIVHDDAEIDSLLAERGLEFDSATNTLLVRGQTVPEERRRSHEAASSVDADDVWDDLSEPHVIGW